MTFGAILLVYGWRRRPPDLRREGSSVEADWVDLLFSPFGG